MSFVIAGRKVASEYIAIATFTTFGLGVWAATRGKKSEQKVVEPVKQSIGNAVGEEEAFIRDFVARMEREDTATKKAH
ncbi:hypothetical protein BT69DRAFT_1347949 [Atractiella rhizophila]|nr:hypothetical protein BT69DRAFT_1347949 [Atractiella rhizophila]